MTKNSKASKHCMVRGEMPQRRPFYDVFESPDRSSRMQEWDHGTCQSRAKREPHCLFLWGWQKMWRLRLLNTLRRGWGIVYSEPTLYTAKTTAKLSLRIHFSRLFSSTKLKLKPQMRHNEAK